MKNGTGIEVEKTGDGIKVTARYYESAPAPAPDPEPEKQNLLFDEIEI